jgi:succinoglycan biosynthesis transport protein ExoP
VQQRSDATLAHYLRVLRHRRWVVIQAIVLVPLAAIVLSLSHMAMYRATSEVLINRQNLASAITGTSDPNVNAQADRIAQTQASLARVPEVANRTLRAVNLRRTADNFLAHSSVTAEPNSDLLRFGVTDHSPQLATSLATAYARQFSKYREELDTAAIQRARDGVIANMKKLEQAGRAKGSLYSTLAERSQQLATLQALQTANVTVVRVPESAGQVQPKPVRAGLIGAALGVILGLGLAFLWEALDTRVRSSEEVEERLGLPLLARLREPPRRLSRDERLVMLEEPRGMQSEAFHMLRANVEFARLGHDARTILITSAVEEEGKSTTVANLAIALARTGQSVVLVDLDLRRPSLHRFFDLPDTTTGLTQVAIGDATLDESLMPIEISDGGDLLDGVAGRGRPLSLTGGSLHVLTAGASPPNAGEFVGSYALERILIDLQTRFDTVLIDSPPALRVVDAIALSSKVDAMIVVVRLKVARRPMLNELKRLLSTAPSVKLGVVLTGASEDVGYGYGQGIYGGVYSSDPVEH